MATGTAERMGEWRVEWQGFAVVIHSPDGRTACLQGDDAGRFFELEAKTSAEWPLSALCSEYESILR